MLLINSDYDDNIIEFYTRNRLPVLYFSHRNNFKNQIKSKEVEKNFLNYETKFNLKEIINKSKELVKIGAKDISIDFLDLVLEKTEYNLYFNENENLGKHFIEKSEDFLSKIKVKLMVVNSNRLYLSHSKLENLIKHLKKLVKKFDIKIILSLNDRDLSYDEINAKNLKNEIISGRFDSVIYDTNDDEFNILLRKDDDDIKVNLI